MLASFGVQSRIIKISRTVSCCSHLEDRVDVYVLLQQFAKSFQMFLAHCVKSIYYIAFTVIKSVL